MPNYQFQTGFTKAITTAITIGEADLVTGFALIVASGTCTIQASGRFQNGASDAIVLSAGQSYVKTAAQGCFLKGYTITPTGTTNIDISQS